MVSRWLISTVDTLPQTLSFRTWWAMQKHLAPRSWTERSYHNLIYFHEVDKGGHFAISGSRTIQGWAAGTPVDSEDTLRFAELTGVRPMIETYPLEKAAEAYARMMSGKAQFRVVLTM
jgi:hypothetical protein